MKEKIYHLSKKMLQHELIRGSSYLFLGTFLANVLFFFFNLFVIRKLSYREYGEYASLISLLALASIPATSIGTTIIRFATDFFSSNHTAQAKKLFIQMSQVFFSIAFIVFIGFILFSGFIKSFLHIQDTYLILWVGGLVVITYLNLVNTSFLQSLLRFDFVAFLALFGAVLKLAFGYSLLLIGVSLGNVFAAIFLSLLIPYFVSFFPLRFLRSVSHTKASIPVREILFYGLPASITVLALSSFTSTDILLVKHFFPSTPAGIYAGLALIGKIIFYFTGTIPSVMFPLLIKRYNEGRNVNTLLFFAIVLVLVPSLAITGFYTIFPQIAIKIILGGKGYLQAAPYIGLYGLYISLFSVINLLVNFFLSLKKTRVVYILCSGALLQIVLITLFHNGFMQVIGVSLLVLLVLFIALLVYYVQAYASLKKQAPDLINNPSL